MDYHVKDGNGIGTGVLKRFSDAIGDDGRAVGSCGLLKRTTYTC